MENQRGSPVWRATLVGLAVVTALAPAFAENIDPDVDGSRYAYGENVGWLNAEPSGNGGPGVQVDDFELTGWMWGENLGWVNLSCKNSLTCGTVEFGVGNDGSGTLDGWGWAENGGWISFSCANTASCGTASYGVTIDVVTGDFSGQAWSENVGWVTFASSGADPYKVKTGWNCSPPPAVPTGSPDLAVDKSGADAALSWTVVAAGTGYDVVQGELNTLRSTNGDFTAATTGCNADNRPTPSLTASGTPSVGDGFWFLVRGVNCGGGGTYDTGQPSQQGLRDAEIAASGNDCP